MSEVNSLHTIEETELLREQGRWLFAQSCTFVRGVQTPLDLAEMTLPEVAFAGRSNVGKSSLINALTNTNALARTSHTPGRTQQLNFFDLGGYVFLVDMPGYGYARVSKKLRESWQALLTEYFRGRQSLERIYLLVDSRVGLKESDELLMKLGDETAMSYQLVLTKIDKISNSSCDQLVTELETKLRLHPAGHPHVLRTSAQKGLGIEMLRSEISKFIPKSSFPSFHQEGGR